jgi:hypothetical protein
MFRTEVLPQLTPHHCQPLPIRRWQKGQPLIAAENVANTLPPPRVDLQSGTTPAASEKTLHQRNPNMEIRKMRYEQFFGGFYPPSGRNLRKLYQRAEVSACTPMSVSNKERYNRELQSVLTGAQKMTTASIDKHFAVLKNYSSVAIKGLKAVFTMIVNDGQIGLLMVVGSTKVQEVSHVLQTAVHRDKLDFHVLWADTWPHRTIPLKY